MRFDWKLKHDDCTSLPDTCCRRPRKSCAVLYTQEAGSSWQFDIFEFAAATPGNTLSLLTFHLLKQSGAPDAGRIDMARFVRFLHRIEAGYNPANPYHNRYHFRS